MTEAKFIGHVGDPDFHDGHIVDIKQMDDSIQVHVKGYSGKIFLVVFRGVHSMSSNKPEGMMLYSLTELNAKPPARKFAFTNWDDDDEAFLEIDAEQFEVFEQ